jgi:hypothetical protein
VIVSAVGIAVALLGLSACGSEDRSGTVTDSVERQTLTVEQSAPELTPIDNGDSGPSVGDELHFAATLTIDGKPAGTLDGVLVVTHVADNQGKGGDKERRQSTLTFRFGEEDSISVSGVSRYSHGNNEMDPSAPQLRSVVGGTGTYLGVRGQVSTTRNDDGTYTHVFTLRS